MNLQELINPQLTSLVAATHLQRTSTAPEAIGVVWHERFALTDQRLCGHVIVDVVLINTFENGVFNLEFMVWDVSAELTKHARYNSLQVDSAQLQHFDDIIQYIVDTHLDQIAPASATEALSCP